MFCLSDQDHGLALDQGDVEAADILVVEVGRMTVDQEVAAEAVQEADLDHTGQQDLALGQEPQIKISKTAMQTECAEMIFPELCMFGAARN